MLTRSRFAVLKPSPLDYDSALICWVPFHGGHGTDFSGNQNNAVAVSTPVFTPSEMGDSYAMSAGKCFQVSTLGASNPISTERVTVACWLKPNATTRGDLITVWNNGGVGPSSDQFNLLYGLTSGKPQFFVLQGVNLNNSGVGSSSMVAGIWYHVAGTFNGTRITVWLNGVDQTSVDTPGGFGTGASNPIVIGASDTTGANNANGLMTDVRVYNRALSGDELTALYNLGPTRFALSPDEWEMPALSTAAAAGTSFAAFGTPQDAGRRVTKIIGY